MPAHDPNERRRFRRLHPRDGAWLEAFRDPDGSGPDIAVALRDVSATGARLVFSERLPMGHVMLVTLNSHSGPLYSGVAIVAWSEEAEDGSFPTGVVFQKPISRADLALLAR
jgi:hypothetical protein